MKLRVIFLSVIIIMAAAGCSDDLTEQACACVYSGYHNCMGSPPPWYSQKGSLYLVIKIIAENVEKLPYGQHGFAPFIEDTDPYYHEWVDYYYIGYDINIIYHHPFYSALPSEIYIPDFLAGELAQNDIWFIETARINTGNGQLGLKRSLYTNDYSYPAMLPVIDNKIIFTEQFNALISDWLDPDIDNYTLVSSVRPVNYSHLAFSFLCQPPLTAPIFETIIAYNEQVLRGGWSLTLGECDLHRREFHAAIDDKLFYNGMTLDELREYFESLANANSEITRIMPEINRHLDMLYSLIK